MYYPTNKDAEQRESEQRIAEHYRRAESVERFEDRSRLLIAAPIATDMEDDNEA